MLSHLLKTTKLTIDRARTLRQYRETSSEKKLWTQLRGRKLCAKKFRRQVPIGPFIADFLCAEVRLVIELDGDFHADRKDYDDRRTQFFENHGYHVLRFRNDELYEDFDAVLKRIVEAAGVHQ